MKIFGVGKNYLDHVKEFDGVVPTSPVIFTKPDSALLRNNTPLFHPTFTKDIHFEVEIVIRICKNGKNIQEKFASKYYDQIGLGIDFTARDIQMEAKNAGLPWALAKGFDGSAPISKLLPISDFKNLQNIHFTLEQNGELKQSGVSSDMIFSFDRIIEHISNFCTLKNGDLIFTGTPAGVGPVKVNDKLECFLDNKKMISMYIK